jgi:hypothetical protein
MNDKHVSDEELVALVFGELDATRQTEVPAAVAEDAELTAAAEGLETAVAAVRAEGTVGISGDFNDRLRRRLRAESVTTAIAPRRRRFWLLAPLPLAAAAAILLVLGLFGPFWPGGQRSQSAMAWADVVRAVNEVRFFHATVYQDSHDKSDRLDFYYRQPNTWRVQGVGQVTFVTSKGSGVYDVAKHGWGLRSEKVELPPSETFSTFAAAMQKGNMLDAVLAALPIFDGKPPAGEPVKSEQAIGGQGMEVFDYAHEADQRWVRIWVLKESRLPIHMVVYQPDDNEFMLVVFDYTTAQPEEFFDLGKFEKTVAKKPGATPEEIYREGFGSVGGKPVDSRQAFKLKGGYKAPVLTKIESDDTGDLLITSENPRNRTPEGHPVPGTYWQQLFDNWGNTYWRLSPGEGSGKKVLRQVYLAVPPFHQGKQRHTITLRYCVRGNDEGSQAGYAKIQSEETVEVPEPLAKGIPESWPMASVLRDPLRRAHALYDFHRARSPLWIQLGTVDPLLAKTPDDDGLLCEKIEILREYNLDEDRFWLFERTLKDRTMANPFDNWWLSNVLGDYLIHLFNAGRHGEFDALLKQLEPLKEKFLASTTPDARPNQDAFRHYTSSLPVALAIPQALQAIENGPRPTVEVLGRSRDGWLWLSVVRPPNRNRMSSDHSWSSPRVPKGSPWTLVSNWGVGDKLFIKAKGTGDEIQLVFDVQIVLLVSSAEDATFRAQRMGWSMTVKVPPASVATAGELTPYQPKWSQGGPGMSAPSPFRLAWDHAERLFDTGQYAAALDAYHEMLSWPRQPKTADGREGKTVPDYIRETLQARPISCLLHLDRLDEAKAAADRLEAESPKPEGLYLKRGARVEIIDWLIDHKRLDEAQKALDQLNRGRVDARLLDCRHFATKVSGGVQSWQPARDNWAAWAGADRAWWRLRQAQTGQRIPPVEP